MQFGDLKHQLEGGGWIDGSWGSEGIAPGDHVLQVAPDTVCRTHGNTVAVWDQCRSPDRYHRLVGLPAS